MEVIMEQITLNQTIEVKGDYDVIVGGGGVAGAAAALSAARAGKSVLLIDKSISLGGLATIGLVNLFVSMCNGRGVQIIKGMADEFLRLSYKHGYDTLDDVWKNGEPGKDTGSRMFSRFSAPIFSLELTKILHDAGVELLFDTVITKPIMEGKRCIGLVVENKTGTEFYRGKMIVDTTGDADILYRAGVPTVQGKNYHTFMTHGMTVKTCAKVAETGNMADLLHYFWGGQADLRGRTHPENIEPYSGTNAKDIARYVITNHLELLENISGDDRSSRDIQAIPTMCQFRTTRHIDGDYTLTCDDKFKHFENSVGTICDFEKKDDLYEVPYTTLVKKEFPNLITAGRCASAVDYAWDILRVIPPAILTGQAAGEACAIAIDDNCDIADIDIAKLQGRLSKTGVDIHFDESLLPDDISSSGETVDIGHI